MAEFKIYIPIAKVNRDQRTVGGWATTEELDKQDEIVDYDASKKAFDNWHGNIREMHEPKAVGKAINVQEDDENKRIYVTAKISKGAEDTWEKVKDGTLTGFSIGGQTIDKRVELHKDDGDNTHKQVTRITKYKLNELSLVDNPANPEAKFELVKSVGGQLQQTQVIEDNVAKKSIKKYNGGEYETMALSKELIGKFSKLVDSMQELVKQDWEDPNPEVAGAKTTPKQTTEGKTVAKGESWEDPNAEVGSAKTTPRQETEGTVVNEGARVGKADMTTDSDLQTQEEDGSDAAPVTKLYRKTDDGKYEEMSPEDAKKMLKADMDTNPDSDLQTQDEDGSDAAPVKKGNKRYARKQDEEDEDVEKQNDEDEDATEKAYDEEDENDTEKQHEGEEHVNEIPTTKTRKVRKARKQADEEEDEDVEKADDEDEDKEKVSKADLLGELRKINKRLDKVETTPMPRKYHKIEKDGNSADSDETLLQKATDELTKAQEESRISGKPLSREMEAKKEWILDKMLTGKFGSSDLRKG